MTPRQQTSLPEPANRQELHECCSSSVAVDRESGELGGGGGGGWSKGGAKQVGGTGYGGESGISEQRGPHAT